MSNPLTTGIATKACADAADAYFSARPHLERTAERETMFGLAFIAGAQFGVNAMAEAAETVLIDNPNDYPYNPGGN